MIRSQRMSVLDRASWLEFRRLKTPMSEFSYNGRIGERVRVRGAYIFFRYRGPASLNASFNGIARSNTGGTTFAPYAVSVVSRADLTEPNHVLDEGFTCRVVADLEFLRRLPLLTLRHRQRRSRPAASTTGQPAPQGVRPDLNYGLHILDAALEYAPAKQLLVRPGIRLMKRDVTVA